MINVKSTVVKNVVLFLIISFLVLGCSKVEFIGSGDTISEFREVAYFNKVSSEGTFNVTITKGNEQKVEIIADDNVVKSVQTSVRNGKLRLHLSKGSFRNVHLEARITILDLVQIENSGSGDVHINNNTGVENYKVINSGSANIYSEGNCEFLDIKNEGSGNVFMYDMPARNSKIVIQGSGQVAIRCEDNLDVKIEGSGNLYFKGQPSISKNISGSGKVINDN